MGSLAFDIESCQADTSCHVSMDQSLLAFRRVVMGEHGLQRGLGEVCLLASNLDAEYT